MSALSRLSETTRSSLRCPACGSPLDDEPGALRCASSACGARFPVLDGVPVLIDEASSLFSFDDVLASRQAQWSPRVHRAAEVLVRFVPSIGANVRARRNCKRFLALLQDCNAAPRVLVVGGRKTGKGMQVLVDSPVIDMVETDVAFGPRTALVCDAQVLPFADGSFDGVVAQAMLSLLPDPSRAVAEIHRVLNAGGLVYAETPFMQQCMGRYDFWRFTQAGLRHLFGRFAEIDSGAVCGPGMALAWSYQYLLLSFARSRVLRALITALTTVTAFYLKYVDYLVIDRPGTLDAASGLYFLGRKADHRRSDRDIVRQYQGAKQQ